MPSPFWTKNLVLERLTLEHHRALADFFEENLEALRASRSDPTKEERGPSDLAEWEIYNSDFAVAANEGCYYGVWTKAAGRPSRSFIGSMQVRKRAVSAGGLHLDVIELGLVLGDAHQRQGYGSECVAAVTHHVLTSRPQEIIGLQIKPDNEPSLRTARRLGFELLHPLPNADGTLLFTMSAGSLARMPDRFLGGKGIA